MNLKVRRLTEKWVGGIELPKFEGKKRDFAKALQN